MIFYSRVVKTRRPPSTIYFNLWLGGEWDRVGAGGGLFSGQEVVHYLEVVGVEDVGDYLLLAVH